MKLMMPFLGLLLLSLTACSTIQSVEEPLKFTLFDLEIHTSNIKNAATEYRSYLGFQVDQKIKSPAYIRLGSGSRLSFVTSDEPSSPEVRRITLKLNRPDEFIKRLEQAQLKPRVIRFTDPATGLSATAYDFPDKPELAVLRFIYFDDDKAVDMENSGQHSNTAYSLHETWIVVDDWEESLNTYRKLGIGFEENVILQPLRVKAKKIVLSQGEILFIQRHHLEESDRKYLKGWDSEIIGASLRIQNVERADQAVSRSKKVRYATTRYNKKSCVLIPPFHSHGLWLELARFRP